jgi:23S rRNA (guanine2445-N2)-methyltransferase / 23S rRNA (guanine2069-N7)-methyltransferase
MASENEIPALDEATAMLVNRLKKNLRSTGKWARRQNVDCYRLYDADIPEYAFAIDCYNNRVHLQEYKAPASIPEEKSALRRKQALLAVESALGIHADLIVLKTRQRQRGKNQYQVQGKSKEDFVVAEGAAKFWVNLKDYLDTGLFLDHRPMRRFIFENSSGKRFLNLFCYTGSATVQAALGGAASTLSIDLSNTYLEWARRNFHLNGIGGQQHRLKRKDCISYLENSHDKFDLIFLDPPTFSNSKKTEHTFDVQRDHIALINNAMKLLAPDGLLIFSCNKRKFKIDSALDQKFQLENLGPASLDKDYERNPRIHQVWFIREK